MGKLGDVPIITWSAKTRMERRAACCMSGILFGASKQPLHYLPLDVRAGVVGQGEGCFLAPPMWRGPGCYPRFWGPAFQRVSRCSGGTSPATCSCPQTFGSTFERTQRSFLPKGHPTCTFQAVLGVGCLSHLCVWTRLKLNPVQPVRA
jgi:hypothetical protein